MGDKLNGNARKSIGVGGEPEAPQAFPTALQVIIRQQRQPEGGVKTQVIGIGDPLLTLMILQDGCAAIVDQMAQARQQAAGAAPPPDILPVTRPPLILPGG